MSDETWRDKDKPRPQYSAMNKGAFAKQPWISKRAPGVSAGLEALFLMIEKAQFNNPGFRYAQGHYGLNDDDLWECFTSWKEGKVHDLIKKKDDEKL